MKAEIRSIWDLKRSRDKVWASEANLAKALGLLREVLDSPEYMKGCDIECLHAAEGLLAAELQHPLWEGRR